MRRRRSHLALIVGLAVSLVAASIAIAGVSRGDRSQGDSKKLRADLKGYQEVPPINTTGQADLDAKMTPTQITFQLDYSDLSGAPAAAHIHIGQQGVNGGVTVFFCGGGGKPACPAASSGSVAGTIVAGDVIGPTAQGFVVGDLDAVENAIRAGLAYANIHTASFPAGEIRGQIRLQVNH